MAQLGKVVAPTMRRVLLAAVATVILVSSCWAAPAHKIGTVPPPDPGVHGSIR